MNHCFSQSATVSDDVAESYFKKIAKLYKKLASDALAILKQQYPHSKIRVITELPPDKSESAQSATTQSTPLTFEGASLRREIDILAQAKDPILEHTRIVSFEYAKIRNLRTVYLESTGLYYYHKALASSDALATKITYLTKSLKRFLKALTYDRDAINDIDPRYPMFGLGPLPPHGVNVLQIAQQVISSLNPSDFNDPNLTNLYTELSTLCGALQQDCPAIVNSDIKSAAALIALASYQNLPASHTAPDLFASMTESDAVKLDAGNNLLYKFVLACAPQMNACRQNLDCLTALEQEHMALLQQRDALLQAASQKAEGSARQKREGDTLLPDTNKTLRMN